MDYIREQASPQLASTLLNRFYTHIYVVSDMSPFMSMTVSHGILILLGLSHLMTIGFGTCTTSHYLKLAGKWWGLQKYRWSNQCKTINVRESGSDQSGWSSHLSLTASMGPTWKSVCEIWLHACQSLFFRRAQLIWSPIWIQTNIFGSVCLHEFLGTYLEFSKSPVC